VISVVSTCAVLFVFKYFNFFNDNMLLLSQKMGFYYPKNVVSFILPIGLSFHTFQSLSYVIEVYRGHQKPEKHFGIYSLYVMFYPQLVTGLLSARKPAGSVASGKNIQLRKPFSWSAAHFVGFICKNGCSR
jgi:D-alanyl-lipoteichoic acid acyltransferase DltB (MBOAT superfamily)